MVLKWEIHADSIMCLALLLLAFLRVCVFLKSKLWPCSFLCKVRALERSLFIRARLCSSVRYFKNLLVSPI